MYLVIKNIKNNKFFSFILLISFFISLVSISVAAIINESKMDFAKMDQIGFNGKNKIISIDINNLSELDKVIDAIQSSFLKSDIYIRNINIRNNTGAFEGVAVNLKNNYYWKPFIKEGRYFTKTDLQTILVGNSTPMEGVQDFNGYSTIGTVTRAKTDIGISILYFPLENLPDAIKQGIISNGFLNLTVINPTKSVDNEISTFRKNISSLITKDIQVNKEAENDTAKGTTGEDKTTMYYYKFLIVSIVTGVSIVLFWIYKKQKELSLKKALGASNIRIIFEFSLQIFLIAFVALLFSSLTISCLSSLIHKYFYTYLLKPLSLHVILSDLVFILILLVVIVLIPMKDIIKIYPGKYLRN